ncbi:MAG: DsbC family protein [Candidatus Protistobacter heckmanni]|nr:DsbC family protein [Candidatus Protistobacter heckmanni]
MQIKKLVKFVLVAALGFGGGLTLSPALSHTANTAQPSNAALEKVKAAVQKQVGQRAQVKSVSATPVPGLYEVNLGREIVYADASGRYIIQGDLIDLQKGENLTEARQAQMDRIKFEDLPLDQALISVHGDGSRKIAVFADPNCMYCKQFESTLQQVNNITVYTFLFPILSEDSTAKSHQLWCMLDRGKAWTEWMVRKVAPTGDGGCATPVGKNLALGKQFNITGTPAIFFSDGTRVTGALPGDALERKLSAVK